MNFQDLIVWQRAHQWVLGTYRLTDKFRRNDQFGLESYLKAVDSDR